LEYPVTQIVEIPQAFRVYLKNDSTYRECSLVCVSAVNAVYIFKISHSRIFTEDFIVKVHEKKNNEVKVNSVSWGEAKIDAPSRFMSGDKLVLTYTFGNEVYFLALTEVEKDLGGYVGKRCEWVLS
jgi:hypothetical protein